MATKLELTKSYIVSNRNTRHRKSIFPLMSNLVSAQETREFGDGDDCDIRRIGDSPRTSTLDKSKRGINNESDKIEQNYIRDEGQSSKQEDIGSTFSKCMLDKDKRDHENKHNLSADTMTRNSNAASKISFSETIQSEKYEVYEDLELGKFRRRIKSAGHIAGSNCKDEGGLRMVQSATPHARGMLSHSSSNQESGQGPSGSGEEERSRNQEGNESNRIDPHSPDNTESKTKTFKSVVERQIGKKDRLYELVRALVRSIAEEKDATNELIQSFETARQIKVPLAELFPASTSQATPKPKRKRSLRVSVPLIDRIERSRQTMEEEATETDRVIAEEMELLEKERCHKTESLIHIPVGEIDQDDDDGANGTNGRRSSSYFRDHDTASNGSSKSVQKGKTAYKEHDDFSDSVKNESGTNDSRKSFYLASQEEDSIKTIESDHSKTCDLEETGSSATETLKDSHSDRDKTTINGYNDSYSDEFDSTDIETSDSHEFHWDKPTSKSKSKKVYISQMEFRRSPERISRVSSKGDVFKHTPRKHEDKKDKQINANDQTLPPKTRIIVKPSEVNVKHQTRSASSKRKHDLSDSNINENGSAMSVTPRSRSEISIRTKSRGSSMTSRRSEKQSKEMITLDLLKMYEENSDLQKIDKKNKKVKQRFRFNNKIGVASIGRNESSIPKHAKRRRKTKTVPLPPKTTNHNTYNRHAHYSHKTYEPENPSKIIREFASRQENRRYKQPDDTIWQHIDVSDLASNESPRTTSREEKLNGLGRLNHKSDGRGPRSARTTTVRFMDMPIMDAIRSVKPSPLLPPCRDVVETTPRKERVSQLYSDLKKDRRGTDYMSVYSMTSSPRNEQRW